MTDVLLSGSVIGSLRFFPSISFRFLSIPFIATAIKMSFVPRRSARLAAKATPHIAPRLVIEEIHIVPDSAIDAIDAYKMLLNAKNANEADAAIQILASRPPLIRREVAAGGPVYPAKSTKEDSRAIFLAAKGTPISDQYKQECITAIKRYLDDVEDTRGRTAKAVVATKLMRYLITAPSFMAANERFHIAVLTKMNEFKQEGEIPDAVVDADFRQTVNDLHFIVS